MSNEDSAASALATSVESDDSNEESPATLEDTSEDTAASFDNTYDANALSFSVSTALIKVTISANESASAVEALKIASILPFSTSMLDCKLVSPAILAVSSTPNLVFKEPSAAIALASSALTSAILLDVSAAIASALATSAT